MGRYLKGTAGFSYKYVYAEQDANLRDLADAADVGRGGLEPLLSASMDELERTDDFPVMEMLRAAVRRTGVAGGETRRLLARDNLVGASSLELVMYAVAESLVPVAALLDERLEAPAQHVELCGRAAYVLPRADHEKLLAWLNGYLARPLALADVGGEIREAAQELHGVDDFLPFLGLHVLHHAVAYDLDLLEIAESMPETRTHDYWSLARREWGPRELSPHQPVPRDPDARFARALAAFWQGERDEAMALLRACHEHGDPRAHRWLCAGGDREAAPIASPPPRPAEDHAAYLEEILEHGEIEATWRASPDLALPALDRLVRGTSLSRVELRRLVAARLRQLRASAVGLAPEIAALASEPLRDAVEDLASAAELSAAHEAADVPATTRLLLRAKARGYLDELAASDALLTMLDHGVREDIARAFEIVRALVPLERRTEVHVAYNLACAAARLGDKPAMLSLLRAAALDGDAPRDALTDKDFAGWHDDPELRTLADELG